MKKYIQKFSNISSTSKLFFFVLILIIVVLFASSSVFIQYKNHQKSKTSEIINPIATVAINKSEAEPVVNSTPESPETNPQNSEVMSPINSASEISPSTAYETQLLEPPAIFKDAQRLSASQTSETPAENGCIKSCPRRASSSKQPLPQIVYRGIKPLSEATSLFKNIVGGLKDLKI